MLIYTMMLQFYLEQLFWLGAMLSFSEFDFKWSFDYLTTLNLVHAIHT